MRFFSCLMTIFKDNEKTSDFSRILSYLCPEDQFACSMKKSELLAACGCLLSAGACSLTHTGKAAGTTAEGPNILLINIDDLGWADVGYHGSVYYETPNIDRLSRKGLIFSNAYAPAANSAPSRACLLTGLNTPRHGVYTVLPAERGKARHRKLLIPKDWCKGSVDESFYLLPEALHDAGYRTCHIGKWHISADPRRSGMDVNIGGNHAGHPRRYFSPYGNPDLPDGPNGEYLMDRLAEEAVRYIDTVSRERPFFLYYAPYAVHKPLQAKPELIAKYKGKTPTEAQDNPVYAAMVENMDRSVGKVLDAVERNGLSEKTLIVFASDNGGVYDVSRQWPLRAGKGSFYEGGIREPLLIYMKGRFEGGRTLEETVSQLDLYPTFADLAGIRLPFTPDGRSLLPLLEGGRKEEWRDRTLFWHFPAYLEAYAGKSESRDPVFRSRPLSALRQGKWKLIEYFEDGALELFDLEADPSEKHDLSRTAPEVAARLHRLLVEWRKETGAPVPAALNPAYKP